MNKNIQLTVLLMAILVVSSIAKANTNNTPYQAVYNHLHYLQPEQYNKQQAAKSFNVANTKQAEQHAVKLKQILDGKGIYVQMGAIPTQANYIDTTTGQAIYVLDKLLPQVYVEKINGKWYYAKETINAIPSLYKSVFPFGINIEQYFKGKVWNAKFLGVKIWQYLCLIMLFAVFYLLYYIIIGFVTLVFKTFTKSGAFAKYFHKKSNSKKIKHLFSLLFATVILKKIVPLLVLPPLLSSVVLKGLDILGVFFILFIVLNIITIVFSMLGKSADKTESKMDNQLLPVLRKMAKTLVWIGGGIYILSYLNVNLTAVLAGLSIGGLALALAAQDTVKNFLGSVMIFIDRPFQIGDWIHFDDIDGIVEEVGIRSTRIRTFSNSLVYVPNAHLANATVDNMGLRKFRRYKTSLGITYDTTPNMINIFVEGIKEIIKAHPTTRKDYFEVSFEGFGNSSLNILLYCFFEANNWSKELKGKHELNYAIIKLANDLGIRFAFPTQTLHIEEFPEKKSLTPLPKGNEEEGKNKSLIEIKDYFNSLNQTVSESKKPLGGA